MPVRGSNVAQAAVERGHLQALDVQNFLKDANAERSVNRPIQ
jgi:hypothetical protein